MREKRRPNEDEILALGSPLARRVELHEEIGSTQERARELARSGAPEGTLVVSRVQSGGKGRLGRPWGSPPGGLWMSLVLRPNFEARLAPRITQTAAVAIAKVLRALGVEAGIKWPNDLLVSGRKICGILAESNVGRGERDPHLDFVVLGIGLNANLDPEDLGAPEATTIRRELGRDVDHMRLLEGVLGSLERELQRISEAFDDVLDDWRMLDCTLGERVRVYRRGETLEGVATDITPGGALVLRTDRGPVEIFEGDVERLRSQGP